MMKLKKSFALILAVILVAAAFPFIACASVAEEECEEPNYYVSVINPTCVEQGYTLHVCLVCGYSYRDTYTPSFGGHDFGAWYTVSEATCTADGLERRECARIGCTGSESKTVPMLVHVDSDKNGLCDICGTEVEIEAEKISPYEWLMKFFEYLRNWFASIFG